MNETKQKLYRLWNRHLEKWSAIALMAVLMGVAICLKLAGVITVPWYMLSFPVLFGVVAFPFFLWKFEVRRRY